MEEHLPARLTSDEGRKFGLTVGIAFLVLGTISRWRGHDTAPLILWGAGGSLSLLGLLIPSRLGPVYRGWMKGAELLSKVTTPVFMGVVYFLVITPMGIVMRLLGKNPLVHRAESETYWKTRQPRPDAEEAMRRQF